MKPFRERNPVTVAVVGLAVLIVLALVAYRADDLPLIGGGTTYTADFSDAAGLRSGNEVRVAGVKVGKVTGVGLDGAKVKVAFRVRDVWIGDTSRVAIMIKTLLGDKYLAVEPAGGSKQRPGKRIPLARTTSPYDVTQAFNGLANTFGQIDSQKVAASLEAISQTFKNTPPSVRKALDGLSALSKTISSRDTQLVRLLAGTKQITGTLSAQNDNFQALLQDGNLLLGEIQQRRDAINALLTGTVQLAQQLSGLVRDNQAQIDPALTALDTTTAMLQRNESSLDHVLAVAAPYFRLLGNAVGNGRWFDSYLCGVIPRNYLPPNSLPSSGCRPPKNGGYS
jgi:phospholipid/cholesterol/gamma-HCH transport system substrate-binding protein